MKNSLLLSITLFVIAGSMLYACTGNKSDGLTGSWKLISYGSSANPTPAVPNVVTSVSFGSDGKLNGNVGCNTFGGNFEMSGDKITFSSIFSTEMYCEKTSSQEQAVLGVLSDKVKLQTQMSGDTLTITSADGLSVVNLARK